MIIFCFLQVPDVIKKFKIIVWLTLIYS